MKWFILVVFLAVFSHTSTAQPTLNDDAQLKNYFSADEIQKLQIIVDFFDQYLVLETGQQNLQKAYTAFNKKSAKNQLIVMDIPADKIHGMYGQVGLPLWNNIWKYQSTHILRQSDQTRLVVPQLDLNLQGKFWQYLTSLGKNDQKIKKYVDIVDKAGTLPPSAKGLYFDESYHVDFMNPVNRLIAAVHYLTNYEQQLLYSEMG